MRRRTRYARKREGGKSNSSHIYLGTRVRDIPPKGLSSTKEAYQIANAIVKDYMSNHINDTKFNQRTATLGLAVIRDKSFTKRQKARIMAYINFLRAIFNFNPLHFQKSMRDSEFRKEYKKTYEMLYKKFEQGLEKELQTRLRKLADEL